MTIDEMKALKWGVLEELRSMLPLMSEQVAAVDPRIFEYMADVASCSEQDDRHCLWQVLAVRKFIRLWQKYRHRPEAVKNFFGLYEKLKFNGIHGRQCYRLTPKQCFQFASVYLFEREDGTRLVRDFVFMEPRKVGKSTSIASMAVNDLLFGDANSQAFMASNSDQQSAIVYREAKALIQQLDPEGKNFRITASEINWKTPNKFGKEGSITRLTAGAKTKDGLNASLAIFDEYAAARYVKDHSDGAELLNVLTSSMGTRREPLTGIITTASRVVEGPFEIMLRAWQDALIECDPVHDYQFLSCFMPDPWEVTDERCYGEPRIWAKVNKHIGVTIQPDFYREEWVKAQQDPEKRKEFLCKYLNIFQTDKQVDWIKPDKIRALQEKRRIDDLGEGWMVFVGCDFSRGDDLCGLSYLAVNPDTNEFFADMDAWVTEDTSQNHTNSLLYRKWIEEGWLHVSPGSTINENLVTQRVMELADKVLIVRIGYDAYDAQRFINNIKQWIFEQGTDPESCVRPVKQTWASYNSSVQELTYMVMNNPALIHFSENPIWAWEFGNAVLEYDRMENCKPIKRTANAKVDNVQCLCSAIILYDELEGKEIK